MLLADCSARFYDPAVALSEAGVMRAKDLDPKTEKLVEKLMAAAWDIAAEHGPLSLMAIFEREDGPGLWDLVVSAPWLREDRDGTYLIAKSVIPRLTREEALTISRILPQDPASEVVHHLRNLYGGPANLRDNGVAVGLSEGPLVGIGPMLIGGVEVRRGYILQTDPTSLPRPLKAVAA